MSFVNHEAAIAATNTYKPLLGRAPYNKKNVDDSLATLHKTTKVFEDHLLVNTFLVGERITLADIFSAGVLVRSFELLLDKKWRDEHPNTTRWFQTVTNQPIFTAVIPQIKLAEEQLKYTPPKKEEKPKAAPKQQEKAAPKPKAKEVDEDEEEDKPAPRPKHPLEALPKPTLVLDDWKRKYSNEETREVALPWFWENFDPKDYSIWKVDYKYNDELTMTFMTSNLIGTSCVYHSSSASLLTPNFPPGVPSHLTWFFLPALCNTTNTISPRFVRT